MILSFKTKINGKPTYFIEKIWESILQKGIQFKASEMKIGMEALPEDYKVKTHHPKLHTIRKDEKNRWKVGTMIDYFINARTKNMFRFAPRIPVKSIQLIKIIHRPQHTDLYIDDKLIESLWVDGFSFRVYSTEFDCPIFYSLARNDGFDDISEFLEYFNDHFEGKIVHWTDFKY